MSRYTLVTYCGTKELEKFNHRSPGKLVGILAMAKHHKAGETGPFGESMNYADNFKIYNSQMESIFAGNVTDALSVARKLR